MPLYRHPTISDGTIAQGEHVAVIRGGLVAVPDAVAQELGLIPTTDAEAEPDPSAETPGAVPNAVAPRKGKKQ